jgi:hypothetical protein
VRADIVIVGIKASKMLFLEPIFARRVYYFGKNHMEGWRISEKDGNNHTHLASLP